MPIAARTSDSIRRLARWAAADASANEIVAGPSPAAMGPRRNLARHGRRLLQNPVVQAAERRHDRLLGVQAEGLFDLPTNTAGTVGSPGRIARSTARPSQPLCSLDRTPSGLFRLCRLPGRIGHRMLLAVVRIADALHDRQVAFLVQSIEGLHFRMEAQQRIDLVQPGGGQAKRRAIAAVSIVAVGNDRVQPIVAAGKLHHDQDRVAGRRGSP